MIVIQAEFIGDNLCVSIPFIKSFVYNLTFEVLGSSYDPGHHHHIGPISIQIKSGVFPDYHRKQFDYEKIESFLEQWKIIKINHFSPNLPKYDSRKVKSLLFENMRDHKLNQLI